MSSSIEVFVDGSVMSNKAGVGIYSPTESSLNQSMTTAIGNNGSVGIESLAIFHGLKGLKRLEDSGKNFSATVYSDCQSIIKAINGKDFSSIEHVQEIKLLLTQLRSVRVSYVPSSQGNHKHAHDFAQQGALSQA